MPLQNRAELSEMSVASSLFYAWDVPVTREQDATFGRLMVGISLFERTAEFMWTLFLLIRSFHFIHFVSFSLSAHITIISGRHTTLKLSHRTDKNGNTAMSSLILGLAFGLPRMVICY